MIVMPTRLRLSNPGSVPANFTLQIVAGTPAAPGSVLHTETGVLEAHQRIEYALQSWADVPVGFTGFARLDSDQQVSLITFVRAGVVDCVLTDLGGGGGPVGIAFLNEVNVPLATYSVTLTAGGNRVLTAAEFPPPASYNTVEFTAAFGIALSYGVIVPGLAK